MVNLFMSTIKVYQLIHDTFDDGCGNYEYSMVTSKNKKQLESIAKKLTKLYGRWNIGYYVTTLEVKNSLTHQEIEKLLEL